MPPKRLQQRVEDLATLNDYSRTFLDNFEINSLYQTICSFAVMRLGLDAAWIEAPGQAGEGTRPPAAHGLSYSPLQSRRKFGN